MNCLYQVVWIDPLDECFESILMPAEHAEMFANSVRRLQPLCEVNIIAIPQESLREWELEWIDYGGEG